MHFIISALGSSGDVHPMVGLGSTLKDRGHRVTLIASVYFEKLIVDAGLELIPCDNPGEFEESVHDPDIWHPRRGPVLMLRKYIAPGVRPIYEAIAERYEPGETVLCGHILDYGSRIAQEKLGAPMASAYFAPVALRSVYESPKLPPSLLGPGVPHWFKSFQYWLADVAFVDRALKKPINQVRRELGLPPISRPMHAWIHSPQLVLAMFPDWFAATQPDWPESVRHTGFPLWDAAPLTEIDPDAEAFLASGDRPVVFAAGSANAQAAQFYRTAAEACRLSGRRGILLTRYPEQLPHDLPKSVVHFDYVPFSRVLPRSAALVHHGGIGTLAQTLAAGIPHIVRPMAYDQFDNADRVERLGVARTILPRRFTAARLARALDELLSSETTAEHCRELAERMAAHNGLAAAADALERLAWTKSPIVRTT